ncbi:MAG: TonB-dependent receptor [Saprospiraceae bacterium]|nr:TonB-dependent receptor [Lewinella sp.]
MIRSLLLCCVFVCSLTIVSYAQTSLAGKITDEETGEPMLFTTVAIYKNGVLILGTETDFDGNYSFSNIDPGTYDVESSLVGYQAVRIADVKVLAGRANKLDITMSSGVTLDIGAVVIDYKNPLIEQDNTTSGAVITSDQIRQLPTRNINALAATSAGVATTDEGSTPTVRGSRPNATNYYVDGIRVLGTLIPESEIEQMQVITGGVEAQYGDVTGGIISITSKGPSNKFSGGIEAETSKFLDPYNNNIIGFNLSGPILRKKDSKLNTSILGFRLSGRYTYRGEDNPPGIPVYRVTDERLAELEANPVILVTDDQGRSGVFTNADFSTSEDVQTLKARPYEAAQNINLNAKLDARLSDAIDVSFTGSYTDNQNQFTPSGWAVYNSHNNPTNYFNSYRGNFRFRHRLGNTGGGNTGERKASTIQNASYTLQAGYEKTTNEVYDPRHGKNYFSYGYIGKFDFEYVPIFDAVIDTALNAPVGIHVGYRPILRSYEPMGSNGVLANYNNVLSFAQTDAINGNIPNYGFITDNTATTFLDDFYSVNGRSDALFASSWNFHSNVGRVYNAVQEGGSDIYTFSANANFDFLPGGSEKGRHNIQLGVWYEQRISRSYTVAPFNLWTIARQQANIHIQGVDVENADSIGVFDLPGFGPTALLDLTINADSEQVFYKRLREALGGIPLNTYVNVDALSPDQLSLDMFSAKELNDQGILSYFGYDYLGNTFDGTFEDFFRTNPVTGIRDFSVAPNRPIYAAAYLQDKFTFKDIIFRVGLRVDRYDANTKVPKDLYSLYEIMGADQFHSEFGGERPGNIGDDYKVYLSSQNYNRPVVQAYRDGDNWYEADGTPRNGPNQIDGIRSGLVFPMYQDERVRDNENFIKSPDFDPSVSFEDYEVQFNYMPRLAFSFPISADANFFAHYDILVQRPPSNTLATPLDYFYFFEGGSSVRNNPRLRPERTIDYEVGFQQRLSNSSAIKMSAYYKEMRDMIQSRVIFPVPVIGEYTTYGNIDFGTVKGFSFAYDMRRTGNVSLQANYTLQLADGTGSNANSQRSLNNRGVIRTLFPLDFDERHRFNMVLDYRYGGGPQYTGPEFGNLRIFENAGLNLQATAVSGRPYTATQTPLELQGTGLTGAINGARKPWTFLVSARIDKQFTIAQKIGLNVYLRVTNLLDRRNVINVYSATGSPVNDGFLDSTRGVSQQENIANSLRELDAYLASYQWALLNPDFYSLPRRFNIGAIMNF